MLLLQAVEAAPKLLPFQIHNRQIEWVHQLLLLKATAELDAFRERAGEAKWSSILEELQEKWYDPKPDRFRLIGSVHYYNHHSKHALVSIKEEEPADQKMSLRAMLAELGGNSETFRKAVGEQHN
jgi:hypothetical protein